MVLFVEYPKCTTCQKAKKWLTDNGVEFIDRHIKEENPTYDELRAWHETSGLLYKSMELKDKLPDMSEDEMYRLLASDGMLVKRPIIVGEDFVLVGFKAQEWERLK